MNPSKFLVTITDLSQIELLKKASVTNFLFPLKDFCAGIPKTFSLDEITEPGYLYLNRILDTKSYEKLREVLSQLPKNIKGLVFEDFGLITLAKELKLPQELILYQTHFATNSESIKENLAFVDSIVISTDITEKEIQEILKNTPKPLVLVLYGLIPAMYSRRTLLTNFEKEFKTPEKSIVTLKDPISKNGFIAIENEYGTILYHDKYSYNAGNYDQEKIKWYWIHPLLQTNQEIFSLLKDFEENHHELTEKESYGFLHQQTIYRLKEVPREKR